MALLGTDFFVFKEWDNSPFFLTMFVVGEPELVLFANCKTSVVGGDEQGNGYIHENHNESVLSVE